MDELSQQNKFTSPPDEIVMRDVEANANALKLIIPVAYAVVEQEI